jgi:hypothetical protein
VGREALVHHLDEMDHLDEMVCEEDNLVELAVNSEAKAQLQNSREKFVVENGWKKDLEVGCTSNLRPFATSAVCGTDCPALAGVR